MTPAPTSAAVQVDNGGGSQVDGGEHGSTEPSVPHNGDTQGASAPDGSAGSARTPSDALGLAVGAKASVGEAVEEVLKTETPALDLAPGGKQSGGPTGPGGGSATEGGARPVVNIDVPISELAAAETQPPAVPKAIATGPAVTAGSQGPSPTGEEEPSSLPPNTQPTTDSRETNGSPLRRVSTGRMGNWYTHYLWRTDNRNGGTGDGAYRIRPRKSRLLYRRGRH